MYERALRQYNLRSTIFYATKASYLCDLSTGRRKVHILTSNKFSRPTPSTRQPQTYQVYASIYHRCSYAGGEGEGKISWFVGGVVRGRIKTVLASVLSSCGGKHTISGVSVCGRPSGARVVSVLSHLFSVICPKFFHSGARGVCGVRRDISAVVRSMVFRLGGRVYIILGCAGRFKSGRRRGLRRFTRGTAISFVQQVPGIHRCLRASLRTTCSNSPTTHDGSRVMFSCPKLCTVAMCHLTRRLFLLNIPLVPHVVARRTRDGANVSVRPNTAVNGCFFVSRNANVIVNRAAVVNYRIGLCRNIALNTLSAGNNRGLHSIHHRPAVNSGMAVCSNTSVLNKRAIVRRKIMVNNGSFVARSVGGNAGIDIHGRRLVCRDSSRSLRRGRRSRS